MLVTEGEKAADAARLIFPEFVVVTSPNGAKAAAQADWSPLAGRGVTIWPDADKEGRDFANEVASLTLTVGVASVAVVTVPETWPDHWDLADKLPDGVTVKDLQQMVAVAPAAEEPKPLEPLPLVRPAPPPQPFPTDALGPMLAPVASALHEIVQSPLAMCANSVLAAATLAAQPHVNIELPIGRGDIKPVSLYFITVGKSGERKSATNSQVMSSIKAREQDLNLKYKAALSAHEDELEVWQAERKKILKESDKATRLAQLAALGPKPKEPLRPIILLEEPTIEGLAKLLLTGQPSVGIFSAEGGEFVGGHAMKDDAKLRSAAGLSKLWDGEAWKRVRAGDGAHTIANKRVSLHLMLQPGVGDVLMSDAVLRDQGLVARLLMTSPQTSMGTRMHREPPADAIKTLADFTVLMAERIARPLPTATKVAE